MASYKTGETPAVFKTDNVYTSEKILESDLVYADSEYKNFLYGMINSTQQLNIDWSKFENHTFFNSAESNVNTAFDTIINKYPFDGTKLELSEFLTELTGFEMFVLNSFPKNTGFLSFENNSHIKINDVKDSNEIITGKITKGEKVINPKYNSFSIESHIYSPKVENDNQIICQKLESDEFGFSLVLSSSTDPETCQLQFIITSGSMQAQSEIPFQKGQFNHICAMYDREIDNNIKIYYNNSLDGVSEDYIEMESIEPLSNYFLIGSGTDTKRPGYVIDGNFIPKETFNGAIDELRFFHNARTTEELELFGKKTIYQDQDENLALYLKFNEPYDSIESLNTTDIVLDSSGNSLHGRIESFDPSLRDNASTALKNPITYEDETISHVLFPQYTEVAALNSSLLLSASFYDDNNPNIITRLIPPHYFLEAMTSTKTDESGIGTLHKEYTKGEFPGDGKLGTSQLMTAILLTWGKYFDEIKMIIDAFSSIVHLDYNDNESSIHTFLPFVSSYYGIELPSFFENASPSQYMYGEDILKENSELSTPLKNIQDELWKRILINIKHLYKSKGTINSIESFLRSAGIDSDSLLRIREYGANAKKGIIYSRQQKTETSTMLDFSGSLSSETLPAHSSDGTYTNMPFIRSAFLSGSRVELGYPEPEGTFEDLPVISPEAGDGGEIRSRGEYGIYGHSNNENDGLFTSGSFLLEGIYSFPKNREYPVTQSLMRLNVEGSTPPSDMAGIVTNIVALSSSISENDHELKCFICPHDAIPGSDVDVIELILTGANIFDGNKWNIAFGRHRNDEIDSVVSSSYYIKCARQSFGEIKEFYSTSKYFNERGDGSRDDIFCTKSPEYNNEGMFFTIGRQIFSTSTTDRFLNNSNLDASTSDQSLSSNFGGSVGHLRMWSKGFTDDEWKEHAKNYTSLGVVSPFENFGFNTVLPGSFQRLRLDTSTDQAITGSDSSGNIEIFDYSQNNLHLSGTGFEENKSVIKPEVFHFGIISPKFDLLQVNNKIRGRGMEKKYNADESLNAVHGYIHELPITSEFFDDPRFAIEFSSIDALNEDIIKMFSSLDVMNDVLGSPNAMFADSYRELENLQQIYFERLTGKIYLDSYLELFKWFNSSFTTIIKQLIPRKTNYMGTNFIIESHMLERHKAQYLSDEIYLKSSERSNHPGIDINAVGDYDGGITSF